MDLSYLHHVAMHMDMNQWRGWFIQYGSPPSMENNDLNIEEEILTKDFVMLGKISLLECLNTWMQKAENIDYRVELENAILDIWLDWYEVSKSPYIWIFKWENNTGWLDNGH